MEVYRKTQHNILEWKKDLKGFKHWLKCFCVVSDPASADLKEPKELLFLKYINIWSLLRVTHLRGI